MDLKMQKEYKSPFKKVCYLNKEKRFSISFDRWQWILHYKSTYHYFGTMVMLLQGLFDYELMQDMEFDTESVLGAIQRAEDLCREIGRDIKLPSRSKL
jgi:hypothetical protein